LTSVQDPKKKKKNGTKPFTGPGRSSRRIISNSFSESRPCPPIRTIRVSLES
jgi:hypothetical protein